MILASNFTQQVDQHLPTHAGVIITSLTGVGGSNGGISIGISVPCLQTARGTFQAVMSLYPCPNDQSQAGSHCAMRQKQCPGGKKVGLAERSIRDIFGISWPTASLKPRLPEGSRIQFTIGVSSPTTLA